MLVAEPLAEAHDRGGRGVAALGELGDRESCRSRRVCEEQVGDALLARTQLGADRAHADEHGVRAGFIAGGFMGHGVSDHCS